MRRRDFIAGLGGAAVIGPNPARGQPIQQPRRIGALITASEGNRALEEITAFRDGMQRLGWIDGRNIKFDYRLGTNADQLRVHAAELAGMNLDTLLSRLMTITDLESIDW
jgi:putative tryptophan/tyrosine transport system substrate-binding protein